MLVTSYYRAEYDHTDDDDDTADDDEVDHPPPVPSEAQQSKDLPEKKKPKKSLWISPFRGIYTYTIYIGSVS